MKKWWLGYFVFCFFSLSVWVNASTCSIDFGSSEIVQSGDEIVVNYYVQDVPAEMLISGGKLYLNFDTNVVNYVSSSVRDGYVINNIDISGGILELQFSSADISSYLGGSGVLATIKFKIKNNMSNQNTVIRMFAYTSSLNTYLKNDNSIVDKGMVCEEDKGLSFQIYDSLGDADLSSLSISNGVLSPGFNKDILEYEVFVSYDVKSMQINGNCSGKNCTVNGLGKKGLKLGNNEFSIVVTAANGNKKEYKIVIKRDSNYEKDSNNYLKSLDVVGYNINPKFSKDILEYRLEVDSLVESIDINAICSGISCTVIGTGMKYLKEGENSYDIKVISETGDERVYTLVVYRKPSVFLKGLMIDRYELFPEFSKDILEYEISVPLEVQTLDISYSINKVGVKVEVIGNGDFQLGENVVEVRLSDDDGHINTYTLKVYRGDKVNEVISSEEINVRDNWYIFLLGIILSLVIFGLVVGLVYYFYKNKKKKWKS